MKNKILLLNLLLTIFNISFAQEWKPLGTGLNGDGSAVFADSADQNLYVGGSFSRAGSIFANSIARWDGNQWHQMDNGEFDYIPVWSLMVYNHELYATSHNNPEHGIGLIAKWNGAQWVKPPSTSSFGGIIAYDLEVFNNELYLGGDLVNAAGIQDILRYDGANWRTLNNGLNGIVLVLHSFQHKLYAGGEFSFSDTIPLIRIAAWDGVQWSALATGFSVTDRVVSLEDYNNELYASTEGSPSGIYKWNGMFWDTIAITDERVLALKAYNGKLYAGGVFTTINNDSISYLAEWDGVQWNEIAPGINGGVGELEVFQGNLHALGIFTEIDSTSVNHIARWQLVSDIKNLSSKENFRISPNPITNHILIENLTSQEELELRIFSISGCLLEVKQLESRIERIELNDLPNGLFVYTVYSKTKVLDRGKFIKLND